jgi:hypothetical protein
MQKQCTRCKEVKSLTSEFFPPHNKMSNGFDSWCRKCRATYRSEICRGFFRSSITDDNLKQLKLDIKNCMICGSEEKLVVDHNHKNNIVRGMLCNHCNRGLGHFRDNPELLQKAIYYLSNSTSVKPYLRENLDPLLFQTK